ncbi:MAG: oligosaccharide flippase family protein [Chitinivibrionales bacterium]|nr:oligosaccharide flippase family protein [Chitinivibrionales bacterium]
MVDQNGGQVPKKRSGSVLAPKACRHFCRRHHETAADHRPRPCRLALPTRRAVKAPFRHGNGWAMTAELSAHGTMFRRLLRQVAVLLTSQVGRILLGTVKASLIARTLGPASRGVYGLAVTVPLFMVGFGSFGIAPAVLYLVARRKYDLRRVLGAAVISVLALGPVLAAVGYLLIRSGVFSVSGSADCADLLWLVVASIPLALTSQIVPRFLHAAGRITPYGAATTFGPASQLVLFLLLVFLLRDPLRAAMWSWLGSYGAIIVLSALLLIPLGAYPPRIHPRLIGEGLRYGLSGYVAQCCELAMFRLDFVFIAHYMDARSLGLYAIATQVAEMVRLFPEAVVTPFVPMLFGLQDSDERRFAPLVVRVMTVVVVVLCSVVGVFSAPLVLILFGREYQEAHQPLLCLLPGIASLSIYYFVRFQLFGRDMAWDVSKRMVVGVLASLILYAVLIPAWGIAGAAMASSASYALSLFLVLRLYTKTTGVRASDMLLIRATDIRRMWQGLAALVSVNSADRAGTIASSPDED